MTASKNICLWTMKRSSTSHFPKRKMLVLAMGIRGSKYLGIGLVRG